MKQNNFVRKEESKNLTTSSLYAQARLKKGVFCKCKDHCSDQCRIATDMDTRREILKKGNICFKYLMPGHIEKKIINSIMLTQNYWQHTRPNTINSNQNNSSITSPANEQTANCLVKSDSTIVLQTASVCVMNTTEDQFCVINVFFDTGSQQTFISDRLVSKRTQISTLTSN